MKTDLRSSLTSLRTRVDVPTEVPVEQPKPQFCKATRGIPNKFGGKCSLCARWVGEYEGVCIRNRQTNKWTVQHVDADACQDASLVPSQVPQTPVTGLSVTSEPHTGIYTVEGAQGHHTFRVYRQPEDEKFMPGALLIEVLTGRDNTSDYMSIGVFDLTRNRVNTWKKFRDPSNPPAWLDDLRTFLANPEAVMTAKNCRVCNRVLTTPDSLAAGCGPICAAR